MTQKHALKKLPKDRRDFKLGQLLTFPALSELPDEFRLDSLPPKHQRNTDFCTAFTTCKLSELQEGVELNPAWSFAVSKLISGDPESFGQDLRTAFKAHVKYGAIEMSDSPFNVDTQSSEFLRNINNYPKDLFDKAIKHKKQSYFAVKGPYDHFDNIRAAIWLLRNFKQGVGSGLIWSFPIDQPFITEIISDNGSGHALPYIGWKKVNGKFVIITPNSYGAEAGDRGEFYLPRSQVNHFVEDYGAFIMVDITPEEAKQQLWGALERLKDLLNRILAFINSTPANTQPVPPITPPEPVTPSPAPVTPEPPDLPKWDTPADARHSARVIMDEYHLSWNQKNLLCAIIQAESQFYVRAKNRNLDGTTDWGICQINDYFWIGPNKYFKSVDEVFNNPDKSIRFMINCYHNNKLNYWVAYKTGAYKKYL